MVGGNMKTVVKPKPANKSATKSKTVTKQKTKSDKPNKSNGDKPKWHYKNKYDKSAYSNFDETQVLLEKINIDHFGLDNVGTAIANAVNYEIFDENKLGNKLNQLDNSSANPTDKNFVSNLDNIDDWGR